MSRAISPATSHAYGLARVARVWRLSRATVYRHRVAPDPTAPAGPTRRGPVGACADAALLEHIRAQILGSRLHGEGYRKIWARLRHAGIRTSARRVRRLMASTAYSRRTGSVVPSSAPMTAPSPPRRWTQCGGPT